MTPAEAREIDRLEFEAECAAIRHRAYALVQSRPVKASAPKPAHNAERTPTPPRLRNPNGRPAKRYMVGGITHPLSQWAIRLNISTNALYGRLKKGWTIEQTITTPAGQRLPKDTVH